MAAFFFVLLLFEGFAFLLVGCDDDLHFFPIAFGFKKTLEPSAEPRNGRPLLSHLLFPSNRGMVRVFPSRLVLPTFLAASSLHQANELRHRFQRLTLLHSLVSTVQRIQRQPFGHPLVVTIDTKQPLDSCRACRAATAAGIRLGNATKDNCC